MNEFDELAEQIDPYIDLYDALVATAIGGDVDNLIGLRVKVVIETERP